MEKIEKIEKIENDLGSKDRRSPEGHAEQKNIGARGAS